MCFPNVKNSVCVDKGPDALERKPKKKKMGTQKNNRRSQKRVLGGFTDKGLFVAKEGTRYFGR